MKDAIYWSVRHMKVTAVKKILGFLPVASLLLAPLFPSYTAHAQQPGQNGIINALENGWITQQDGCSTDTSQLGQTFFSNTLTNPSKVNVSDGGYSLSVGEISWAPDGSRYTFHVSRPDELGITNTDGSAPFGSQYAHILSVYSPTYSVSADSVAWSPDGQTLAFANSVALFTMRSNGSNLRFVTWGNFADLSWSSDGSYIAFTQKNFVGFPNYSDGIDVRDQLGIIHPDGTGLQLFSKASTTSFDQDPDWSPDGTKLVFDSNRSLEGTSQWTEPPQLFTMSADGLGIHQLTSNYSYRYEHPVWSPDGTKILATKTQFAATPASMELVILNAQTGAEITHYTPPCNVGFTSIGWQPIASPLTYPTWPESDPTPTSPTLSSIYRFYSPLLKHHLFTSDSNEASSIMANFPSSVWSYEGVAFKVNGTSNCSAGRLVYRFYSEALQTHLYTMDENEKNTIITTYPSNVWRYEGVAYCADQSQVSGTQPVYRFYSELFKTHLYTMDSNEKNYLQSHYSSDVYRYEGIAYYAYPD